MAETINVLVVDDQTLLSQALENLLAQNSDMNVIGIASDGHEAIKKVALHRPDVVLLDVEMPKMDGLSATRLITQRFPKTKVILLSAHDDDAYLINALKVGAKAYLLKNTLSNELTDTIRNVYKGFGQFGPGILEKLVASMAAADSMHSPADKKDASPLPVNLPEAILKAPDETVSPIETASFIEEEKEASLLAASKEKDAEISDSDASSLPANSPEAIPEILEETASLEPASYIEEEKASLPVALEEEHSEASEKVTETSEEVTETSEQVTETSEQVMGDDIALLEEIVSPIDIELEESVLSSFPIEEEEAISAFPEEEDDTDITTAETEEITSVAIPEEAISPEDEDVEAFAQALTPSEPIISGDIPASLAPPEEILTEASDEEIITGVVISEETISSVEVEEPDSSFQGEDPDFPVTASEEGPALEESPLETPQETTEDSVTTLWETLSQSDVEETLSLSEENLLEAPQEDLGEAAEFVVDHIINRLIDICRWHVDRNSSAIDFNVCWTLFDLFGHRALTSDIVEQLTPLLIKHPEFKAEYLCRRLHNFYWRWSHGEFINAASETFPQRKMRALKEKRKGGGEVLGQRQIDMYTGLNTMILLWELHRYGLALAESQASQGSESLENPPFFHPCDHPDQERFDAKQLLKIIGISQCLGTAAFRTHVCPFLQSASLRGANLSKVNLSGAELNKADLRSTNLSGADFSRADLSDVDLLNANLSRIKLFKANLRDARLFSTNLEGANLSGADLCSANLNRSNLNGADLRSASLIGAGLVRTNFGNANLRGANLNGANLSKANLCDADLRSVNLIDANLRNANLSSAKLGSADLNSADLSSANLSVANLSSADLRNANLRNAHLGNADLSNADLDTASLSEATLFAANLFEADLSNADLSEANLFEANLSSAVLFETNLRSANLSHADLFEASLNGADLSGADIFEANLRNADLSGASLRGTDLRATNLVEVNLRDADLSTANLFNANLSGADLRGANLRGANLGNVDLTEAILFGEDDEDATQWDEDTHWEGVKGLENAIGVPEELLERLGLIPPKRPRRLSDYFL